MNSDVFLDNSVTDMVKGFYFFEISCIEREMQTNYKRFTFQDV